MMSDFKAGRRRDWGKAMGYCALILAGGILAGPSHSQNSKEKIMNLTSPSFSHNGTIPARHTCDGQNLSPPLSWSDLPAGTKSLVLIVDDPDAPDPTAPKTTWVHWLAYNLPPSIAGLAEGGGALPAGTLQGLNDWQRSGYGGPCPLIGTHRYFHKLYALDTLLPDLKTPTKATLEQALRGHVIDHAELVGRYQRKR